MMAISQHVPENEVSSARKMKEKGYDWIVLFQGDLDPLYFKNLADIGPFMRERLPEETDYRGMSIEQFLMEVSSG